MATTNVLQVLRDHHQQISGLFELVRNSPDLSEKLTLFQELKDELEVHALVEEKIFYPAVATFDEVAELLDRVFDTHDEISDWIEDIDQMEVEAIEGEQFDTTIDEFDDAIDELRVLYARHVDQNEKELYPEVTELLDEDDLIALANQVNEVRGLGLAA